MLEVILEAIVDSLKTVPFLFIAYFLIEYIEHRQSNNFERILRASGRYGSTIGALLGVVPQCGFSVMATNLFSSGVITTGTLLAVYLSTSDEAIPILVSNPEGARIVLTIIPLKIIFALVVGLVYDLVIRKRHSEIGFEGICEQCNCEEDGILKSAIRHTIRIFLFVLLITLLFNVIIFFIGEDLITTLFMTNSMLQPFLAALIGLIPNCAASVLLTNLYITGTVSFGSLVAGLCTGAGVGLAVLFKTNPDKAENFQIVAILYLSGALFGLLINLIIK